MQSMLGHSVTWKPEPYGKKGEKPGLPLRIRIARVLQHEAIRSFMNSGPALGVYV